jgi:hypothetical protein
MSQRQLVGLICSAALISPLAANAQQGRLIGGWRATNECFLAAFVLADGGRVQTAYLSGEHDDNAAWTWDGSTLRITSPAFPLDLFTGRLTDDHFEVDYVWHNLDKDELNRQSCVFERFTPRGRDAVRQTPPGLG